MKTFVSAKIHGIRVTQKAVRYNGSVAIAASLLREVGIEDFEQVHIVNLTNGNRWVTYAIPAPEGVFSLNGGGARLGEIGDECVVMTYATLHAYKPAKVIHLNEDNSVHHSIRYNQSHDASEL
jgi:aspartate 1-decarboxylase